MDRGARRLPGHVGEAQNELARDVPGPLGHGADLEQALSFAEFRVPPTKELIKKTIVDEITAVMFPGRSTSKLNAEEFSELIQVIQMNLAERLDVTTPFGWEDIRATD